MLRRSRSHASTIVTRAMAPSARNSHPCVVVPRNIKSWSSRIPWVTGKVYASGPDRLGELGDREHETAEEDRGQQHEQRQLDGLAFGVGDHRDQQSEAERGQRAAAAMARATSPDAGRASARRSRRRAARRHRGDDAADQPECRGLAGQDLPALTGEMRKSSMTPLVRSRTSDSRDQRRRPGAGGSGRGPRARSTDDVRRRTARCCRPRPGWGPR